MIAFIDRVAPAEPFDIDLDSIPPPEEVRIVSASEATHIHSRDPVVWLVHKSEARCYPWWIIDNRHMLDDEVRGDPPRPRHRLEALRTVVPRQMYPARTTTTLPNEKGRGPIC